MYYVVWSLLITTDDKWIRRQKLQTIAATVKINSTSEHALFVFTDHPHITQQNKQETEFYYTQVSYNGNGCI